MKDLLPQGVGKVLADGDLRGATRRSLFARQARRGKRFSARRRCGLCTTRCICVRGYALMERLYKRERAQTFDDDGWHHTGDLGYFSDGYLFFKGRLNDMIKSHGANIAPREVEVAMEFLPPG